MHKSRSPPTEITVMVQTNGQARPRTGKDPEKDSGGEVKKHGGCEFVNKDFNILHFIYITAGLGCKLRI